MNKLVEVIFKLFIWFIFICILDWVCTSKDVDSSKQSVVKNPYIEKYKENTLWNGSTPYDYCFGSYNNCEDYGCSKIQVRTPYNSAVVVTIKKNDIIYRHAYIQKENSFTFVLPNGNYQTFFYYGKGWNPDKFMKNSICGELRGGFVMNEHFGKDYPQNIYNQILTYELVLQSNGNFSTKGSNMNEAL